MADKTLDSINNKIKLYETLLNSAKDNNAEKNDIEKSITKKALEDFKTKINETAVTEQVSTLQDWLQTPPRYFKPSFLLATLAPRVHIRIIINQNGVIKKWDLFDQVEGGKNMFDNTPHPTHNNIKNFKYAVCGEGTDKLMCTFEIIDADAALAEAMMLRFTALHMALGGDVDPASTNILAEVEYGWSVPAHLEEQYKERFGDSASVAFTQNILVYVTKPSLVYKMDGSIDMKLECRSDVNLLPPLLWWKPYETFGKNPALQIVLINFIETIVGTWSKIVKGNVYFTEVNVKAFVSAIGNLLLIEYLPGAKKEALRPIVAAILRLFTIEFDKVVETIITDAFINVTMLVLNNPKNVGSLGGTTPSVTQPIDVMLTNIAESSVGNALATVTETREATSIIKLETKTDEDKPAKMLLNIIYNNSKKDDVSVALSSAFKSMEENAYNPEHELQRESRRVVDFVNKIIPVLMDSYIHPLVVEEYLMNKFKAQLSQLEYSAKMAQMSVTPIYVSMIDPKSIEPVAVPGGKSWLSYYETVIVNKKSIRLTRAQKERWLKRVNEFNITYATSWLDAIMNAIRLQRININTEGMDAESKDIIQRNKIADENKKEKTNSTSVGNTIPVQATSSAFIATAAGAKANLAAMIKILQKKDKPKLNNKATEAETKANKSSLEELTKLYNSAVTQIDDSTKCFLFIFKDILASSSMYNKDITNSEILQAYSVRAQGSAGFGGAATQWNPGWPSMWDINYFDVLSFEPEFDFHAALLGMMQATKPLKVAEGVSTGVNELTKLAEDAAAKYELVLASQKTTTAKGGNDKTTLITDLREAVNKLKAEAGRASTNFGSQITHPLGANMDFSSRRTDNGTVQEVLEAKRNLQEFRKKIMMTTMCASAKMKVLGDASFFAGDMGKFIFVKVINNDGSLSLFTGLYRIKEITQEISGGKFETSFSLMQDNSINDVVRANMEEIIYNSDHMAMTRR